MELDTEENRRPWHQEELVADGADASSHVEAKSRSSGALAHRRRREHQSVEAKTAATAAAMVLGRLGVGAMDFVRINEWRRKTTLKRQGKEVVSIRTRVTQPDRRMRAHDPPGAR